ncbi:MAG: DUF4127 family protein [Clostridia bacterium]|nr:DUF4127 family protein [Clostridia bacterium]
MTSGPVALVPLDDRPCTTVFPVRIAEMAGIDVVAPPPEILGRFLEPGLPDAVLDWLESTAPNVSAMLVSLEMVLYGGLIASRSSKVSLDIARRRLGRLARIAMCNPTTKMLVSGVIMRITTTGRSSEFLKHWEMLHRFSVLTAKSAEGVATAAELRELDDVKQQLPPALLEDHLNARRRNHAVNLMSVALASMGVFGFLMLGQEDADVYGPHMAEQRALLDYAGRLAGIADGMPEFLCIHPGADELNMTLLARHISDTMNVSGRRGSRPRVSTIFMPEEGRFTVPKFEDRPLAQSVESQIIAAGAVPVEAVDGESDIVLLVHAPDPACEVRVDHVAQGAQARGSGREYIDTRILEKLADSGRCGKTVAVADVRTANGADVQFVRTLLDMSLLNKLSAYAGWNTAANSIGTALATAIAAWANPDNWMPRARFLFERLVDDYLYQSCTRAEATSLLQFRGMDPWNFGLAQHAGAEELALATLRGQAEALFEECFPHFGPECCRLAKLSLCLPWDRLFECKVDAAFEPEEDDEPCPTSSSC